MTTRHAVAASILGIATLASVGLSRPTYKIVPGDGGPDHEFGHSIDLRHDVAAIGAPFAGGVGRAYLYDVNVGERIAELVAGGGSPGDEFGRAVAIGDEIVVIGAPRNEHGGVASGAAYIFSLADGSLIAKIAPLDGDPGDEFGGAVATDGVLVVVGSKRDDDNGQDAGAIYLFDAATGAQLDKITPADGASNDNFGGAVAIDGGLIAAGAHGDWDNGPLSGSAYLFDAETRSLHAKLLADNGSSSDFFGSAIDIDNGLVVVGAWARSVFYDHSGVAYIFDAATGSQTQYIVPADGHDRDHFGICVALHDGVAAVGAHQDGDAGFNAGSAYLFDAHTGSQLNKLLPTDGANFIYFGSAIAIHDGVVAVGALGDEDNGPDAGAAYIFGRCPGDATGDGLVNFDDLNAVLAGWGAGAGAGDVNGDDLVNFDDLNAVLINWDRSCS